MKAEKIKYSLKNMAIRKTRSFLTVLSIMIGIAAIFTLISFGSGIRHYMNEIANEAGADKLFIQAKGIGAPGTNEDFFLTKEEIGFVKKIKGVKDIAGIYIKPVKLDFKKQTKYVYSIGYNEEDFDFVFEGFSASIIKGRKLKKGELSKALLGYNYLKDKKIFSKALSLGDKININGRKFEAVGFLSEIGNAQDDSNIYITKEAFESLYPEIKGRYGFVMLRSEKSASPESLADKIEEKLRKYKGQKKGQEDFSVQTFNDVLKTFGTFISIINGVLILIALISVIVASVNIMNTMYTSVVERTKEIGIMKAIGAKNKDIVFIFVFESGLLGLVGGIIGEIIGYFISSLGGIIAANAGFSSLKPYFSLYLIIGCMIFSFLIGSLSGLLPAFQASKLKPVDALRYE